MLRVLSCCLPSRVSKHRDAQRELVLQRLSCRQETPLQGHPVGESGPLQVGVLRHLLGSFQKQMILFAIQMQCFNSLLMRFEQVVASRGDSPQERP